MKSDVEVLINGKVLTLSGSEGEEYIQKVALYINNKIAEYKSIEGFARQPLEMQNILVQLNIADEYFKIKEQMAILEEDMLDREKELYELKHELISVKMKLEEQEKDAEAILNNCVENEKKVIALQAELKEAHNKNIQKR